MTHTIAFSQEFAYPGQRRASLIIEVVPPTGATFELRVVLDTGASISKFDHALAARMGITNIRETSRIIQPRAVDNASTVGYVHPVTINFLGRQLTIPIVFCPDWPAGGDNLLGMEGFFEHGIFAFEHARQRVYINV
ncbi:MAG: retroviral-like aspartic protease [Chloroflexi bacterium]|nr:retroviral-like aspartic protease [Chloroflexota bacterium]